MGQKSPFGDICSYCGEPVEFKEICLSIYRPENNVYIHTRCVEQFSRAIKKYTANEIKRRILKGLK